ncbi:MAG: sulfide/dihydroorotate dehydrogenase-like FAD/NAD-binding protein [Deltaproteobacteria bacterium]|nr:sulfide/dihydroorotate dehydrogenase-like FAD/NAD-binding protein [Candidatus Zymogenaceae bacterium]
MAKIVTKERLSEQVVRMTVVSPRIARKRKAGQFVVLIINEQGERIPLTIVDSDPEIGTLTIIFQEVGKSTMHLGALNEGDEIAHVVGPLGRPTYIENFGTAVCVGGGVGIAALYPITHALHDAGNRVISIIGARNKDLLMLEDEMGAVSDELLICTDDGSYGPQGFVTSLLSEVVERKEKIKIVVAVGPVPMMHAVAELTRPYGINTVVSLNSIMLDGTGMCGTCRCEVGGKTRFVCVEGPEFDGHEVDFDGLAKRQKAYLEAEKKAVLRYSCGVTGEG